ncbi:hypothetical protein LTR91_002593 [Friedmanniomyces endolithicus]|uniref:Uncharacterized protein n=1 Tax=Friedmanniomyces endolithicus TaxID=329885 RepID=A0AAN6FT32_9PEZI|nr:hypothetical protein LTR82_006275 [Friedmanniomyces endolithicus]KAK0920454.1 hypothetical protein LTR57_009710 [Friedmanniomyces endolithicus]KAK0992799.1 hypothetical protein LTS01_007764 [Friedmanniomyces endolithicus]KAK1010197.1 hypothetical protein LTR91_002593 [Friedmanniomyces endolithicus]KAK1047907.1 hypothetical protein LTS16_004753 [Friedmanniomyces endolithicus]
MAPPLQQTGSAAQSLSLLRFTPQLPPNLTNDQKRRAHDARVQASRKAAARFVPSGPFDVTFASLRMVIFSIEETSATLVAQVIREELNDTQICKLLERVYNPDPKSEKCVVRSAALYKKIKQARIQLAKNLRDSGSVDVDVIYQCEHYRVEPFKSDKERVSSLGGKVYHMYPIRKDEQEMAFSVVVQPWILELVYPPGHREQYDISFKTNTAPAPPDMPDEAGPLRPNTIFPNDAATEPGMMPMQDVEGVLKSLTLDRRAQEPKHTFQEVTPNAGDSVQKIARKPENSLKKVKATPNKTPTWHPFDSNLRPYQKQPKWLNETAPFNGDPGILGNAQWWMEDYAAREAQISAWDQETRVIKDGRFTRTIALTDADPATAKPGVDFRVVPPLGGTYNAERNFMFHRDSLEGFIRAEDMRAYKIAETAFEDYILKAKVFYTKYTAIQANTQFRAEHPGQWEKKKRAAEVNEQRIKQQVKVHGDYLQEMGQRCGLQLNLSKFAIIGQLEKKLQTAAEEAAKPPPGAFKPRGKGPASLASKTPFAMPPDTPRPAQMALRPRAATRARVGVQLPQTTRHNTGSRAPFAPAPPTTSPPAVSRLPTHEWQASSRSPSASSSPTTIPFPPYNDPTIALAGDVATDFAGDVAGTQQDIHKPAAPLAQKEVRRTNTGRALKDLLAQTGVKSAHEGRVDSARASGEAVGSFQPGMGSFPAGLGRGFRGMIEAGSFECFSAVEWEEEGEWSGSEGTFGGAGDEGEEEEEEDDDEDLYR